MATVLDDDEVDRRVPDGWERENDEIVRVYEFDDYLDAASFLEELAEIADEENHHPEMTLRWGEVEVHFTTHDAGGITKKDLRLAERCNDEY